MRRPQIFIRYSHFGIAFSDIIRYNIICLLILISHAIAGIAQSVEQLIRNQQVVCSSHIASSKKHPKIFDFEVLFLFLNLFLLFRKLNVKHKLHVVHRLSYGSKLARYGVVCTVRSERQDMVCQFFA